MPRVWASSSDANVGKRDAARRRRDHAAARPRALPVRPRTCRDIAEVWRRGSVIASWLLDLTAAALAEGPAAVGISPGRVSDSGEGRWTIKAAIDEAVPVPRAHHGALRAVQPRAARPTLPTSCSRRCASSSAGTEEEDRASKTQPTQLLVSCTRPPHSRRNR